MSEIFNLFFGPLIRVVSNGPVFFAKTVIGSVLLFVIPTAIFEGVRRMVWGKRNRADTSTEAEEIGK